MFWHLFYFCFDKDNYFHHIIDYHVPFMSLPPRSNKDETLLIISIDILSCVSPSSRRHLRLLGGQRGRAVVPGGSDHLRDQEERGRLVRRRHERHHRPLPRELRGVHHALRRLRKRRKSVCHFLFVPQLNQEGDMF